MQKLDISLKKIEVVSFSVRDNKVKLKITYDVNNVDKSFVKEYSLSNPEILAQDIIADSRNYEKTELESDEILKSIQVIDIENYEDSENKIIHFLNRFKDGLAHFKSMKTSEGYMDKYHELSKQKLKLR